MATNENEKSLLEELESNQPLSEEVRKRAAEYVKLNEQQKKSLDYLKEQVESLKQQQQFVNAISDEQGRIIEKERVKLDLQQAEEEVRRKELLDLAKGRDLTEADLTALIKIEKKLEDINQKKKDLARAEGAGQGLANLLGISEANKNSLTYQMFKNPKLVMDGFKGSLEDAGGFLKGSALSILMKIQEATVLAFYETDKAITSFVAATGASRAYNDVIVSTARGNTALGISFAESGKAVTALYENLNTFTTLSTSAQASLTVTTAKLEKLGISGGETAKSIQTLSMMMGVSEVQAAKTVEKFAAMGQAIGVSSKQMISDFSAVKEQLAVFGKTIDETFIKLEAQSKATGVAINDLLTITNKFDTFEGAANQVGNLNAVLGGTYLSAMSMIETTDPTERINMIRDAVNQAGMSFESMEYYEKKAVMAAAGFKSVEEAQRVLSMSAGEAAEELQKQQASQKQLNDAIERAQPIQEKLSLIMANFAIVMEPVVNFMSAFLSDLLRFLDSDIGSILKWGVALLGIAMAIKNISVAWTILSAVFTASPIGAAILALTALAYAIWKIHDIFFVPHSPILFDALKALPNIFKAIAEMVVAFTSSILAAAVGLPVMATGLFGVAAGVSAFSVAMLAATGAGLVNGLGSLFGADLASQIQKIAESLQTIPKDNLVNFKVMMEKIVEVSEPATLKGFEKFSEKFDLVAQATAKVDASKTQTFTQMLTATQNLSQALNLNQTVVVKIGSDKFKGVIEKIIDNKMPDNSTSAV